MGSNENGDEATSRTTTSTAAHSTASSTQSSESRTSSSSSGPAFHITAISKIIDTAVTSEDNDFPPFSSSRAVGSSGATTISIAQITASIASSVQASVMSRVSSAQATQTAGTPIQSPVCSKDTLPNFGVQDLLLNATAVVDLNTLINAMRVKLCNMQCEGPDGVDASQVRLSNDGIF